MRLESIKRDIAQYAEDGKMPALALGPGGGNAHGADEFVKMSDLVKLVRIYAGTAVDWCGVA